MKLGDRMKTYESVSKNYLTRRIPAIIRIDGKSFHTFTRGMKKPFDDILVKTMQETMLYLCENIQGCVLGYTQSDEITLVLTDYESIDTCAWFDYNVQKMVSISASMATLAFNNFFRKNVNRYMDVVCKFKDLDFAQEAYFDKNGNIKVALFDSRVFNVPKEEVVNCLIWRQQDATRNSIQSVGQANFSHKELNGKKCNEIQDMLMLKKNINWNDIQSTLKRGSCAIKRGVSILGKAPIRKKWVIDNEIPIFSKDRDYIETLL